MGVILPDSAIGRLKRLWSDGLSASQIALEMGRAGFPMSRSAVCGRARRLGLEWRSDKNYRASPGMLRRRRSSTVPADRRAAQEALDAQERPPLHIPLLETKSFHCRWIGPDDTCCGHQTVLGGSWCAYHTSVVFKGYTHKREVREVPFG